jgi:hypothetical protein
MPIDGAANNDERRDRGMGSGDALIELFLSPAGGGAPSLPRGLGTHTLAESAHEDDTADLVPVTHLDPGGDPGSLGDQGWGVIAPRGDAGDRLLALARPLLDQRAADQGREVPVHRVPPGMSRTQAAAWIDRKLVDNALQDDIPGYLLVLGPPDEVSFELQQVLAGAFSVGRLAFDREPGYEAYIAKLLASERAAAPSPARAVYFAAGDGTPATDLARRRLIEPCIADAEQQRAAGRFAAREIVAIDDDDPARAADRLLAAAAAAGPNVVFSSSHGTGAPRGGWPSPGARRAQQGALWLGGRQTLDAELLAQAPFAPGGAWLVFACFAAGTPARSAYHPWLSRLEAHGAHGGDLASVLVSLPAEGEPPFVSALAQAALANPRGPLAVIGHVDLAWSYGFLDLDKRTRGERHRRFHELMAQLVKGTRVGLALAASLQRARNQVQTELAIAAGEAEAETDAASDPAALERVRLGHRWMVLRDLEGYVALGDPAARLHVPRRA